MWSAKLILLPKTPESSKAACVREQIYKNAEAAMPAAKGVTIAVLHLPGAKLECHSNAYVDCKLRETEHAVL